VSLARPYLHSFPTRRSSDLVITLDKPLSRDLTIQYRLAGTATVDVDYGIAGEQGITTIAAGQTSGAISLQIFRDEERENDETVEDRKEHTSELQSRENLVCR